MERKRLIFVMHQMPFIFKQSENKIVYEANQNHLAQYAGSQALESTFDMVYVGWDNQSHSDELKQRLIKEKQAYLVELDPIVSQGHYEGYCKSELWPLFHYILWSGATSNGVESKNWADYKAVNDRFADVICDLYQEGDLIWIQDYHLMLLPSILRNRIPKATIGFFLHTPFPTSEILRCLPKRSEILAGVLGASLVGFQTYSHARHFISSCTRVIGCESHPSGLEYHGFNVQIGIFPVGIDLERTESIIESAAVKEKKVMLRELFKGKKIIVGRDTMDRIKGVQQKLDAFQKFLELYPEWRNKVALVQVSTPHQKPNLEIERKISETVSKINGAYGSLQYVPVHHYHHRLDPEEYYALLCVADVALITPLRDGMNTTSHDFIVCQKENQGTLVLSEFTGTANAMSGAILVNPWDVVGVAHAINDALVRCKDDKELKHKVLQINKQLWDYVSNHTAKSWANRFIKELIATTTFPDQSNPTPFLNFDQVSVAYRSSSKRLLLFDYDGTLTPIVKNPNAALPPPEMLKALEILSQDEQNVIFIISGRDQQCLDNWLGHIPNLGLSAEHGSFIKYPGGKWINLAAEIDLAWKNDVIEIFNYYTERTQGSFVEHKQCSITWHYRLADPEYGLFQAKECQLHLEEAIQSKLPVEVMVGKKNLEVRPISMNKGEIVRRLVSTRQPGCDFVFCVGDDRTDEDMFKILTKSELNRDCVFTCTIGTATKMTRADYHVTSPYDVISLLTRLAFEQ